MPKKKNMTRNERKLRVSATQSSKKVWEKEEKRKKTMKIGKKMTFDSNMNKY